MDRARAEQRRARQGATGMVLGLALGLAATLSGCDEIAATGAAPATASAPQRIGVSDRAVVISGPQGYCIDRTAATDGPEGAFVLLGSCAALSQLAAAGQPVAPAVLTAFVSRAGGQPVGGQLPALNSFFQSADGRAALSRSGNAQNVKVLQAWGVGGVYFLAVQDSGTSGRQKLQPTFWRAVFDVKGRIVTLNVAGLKNQPLSPAAGRATLEAFVRQVQRENGAGFGG